MVERGLVADLPPITMEPLTPRKVLETMRTIKARLGERRVIWVSHMRPPDGDPDLVHLIKVRENLAGVLKRNAAALGDEFFDPSDVIRHSPEDYFKTSGDYDHLSEKGAYLLGHEYLKLGSSNV